MPIEITELVIKAQVGGEDSTQRPQTSSSGTRQREDDAELKAIKQTVKQTLDIIKRKNER